MMGDEGDEENSDLPTMRRSDARRELATVEKIQTAPGNPYRQAAEEPSRGLRDARAAGKYATTEILAMNSKPITAPIRVADDNDQLGEYVNSGPNVAHYDQGFSQPLKRSIMTAPFGADRRARMFAAGFGQTQGKPAHIVDEHNFFSVRGTDSRHRSEQVEGVSQSQSIRMRGGLSNCFVEGDLLKATNIYQQFDRKGNVYENRLYAKTSINQAKLNKQQASFVRKMDDMPDEVCRIQNGTMTVSA